MDKLTFARFESIDKLPSKQRLKILEKIDANYCFQEKSNLNKHYKHYDGSTYLHLAVLNENIDCIKQLLSQGADLLKQTTFDGKTPLLEAVELGYNQNCIQHIMGKLELEIADILLSEQIKTGNTLNPKDKYEMSHLHVACIFNHAEAVKFLLVTEESLNRAMDTDGFLPGYTPLHCAVRYSAVESAEILVNCGADVFLKDAEGRNSLWLLVERLMKLSDYMNMGKRFCCSFFKAEMKRIEAIIYHILKTRKADEMNFTDDRGLTAFHLACALSDKSIAESFLEQDIDINASINTDAHLLPGYTPLHFAACFNVETVKLLLQKGGDITKTLIGKSPLDLCMERYSPQIIHSILCDKPEFKSITLLDGSTSLLDLLLLMNDCDKFKDFLQNSTDINMSVPHDSPLWPSNTLLHFSVMMNEKIKTIEDLECYGKSRTEVKNTDESSEFYNCTEIEELNYWKRIVICLVRGCSLSLKNADGLTPIHLAFKLHKAKIVDKFMNSCKINSADPNNLSHLHIACVIGKTDLVERFLNKGADVNSLAKSSFEWYGKPRKLRKTPYLVTVQANSTPLHLAVIFEHIEIINLLLRNGADVYAQDARGLTPIHLSIELASQTKTIAKLLLNNTPNLKEVVSKQNLTHLHVAAFVNNGDLVDKLIKSGSEVDATFNIQKPKKLFRREHEFGEFSFLVCIAGETPLYIAMKNKSGDAVRVLLRSGADIFKIASDYLINPFRQALLHLNSDYADCVIKKVKREFKHEIRKIDQIGVTALHIACGRFDFAWAKDLLKRGANVNAQVRHNIDDCNPDTSELWNRETPLHVLINELREVKTVPKDLISIVKLLLKYGASVTIKDHYSRTPLHLACDGLLLFLKSHFPIAGLQSLLLRNQKNYQVNPSESRGFSHFYIACMRGDIEIVAKFLDNGVDINHPLSYFLSMRDDAGFTALHFAFHHKHVNLARLLIERGANVKAEATNGNTPLHIAAMNNCVDLEILEMFYRNGADFNAKNLQDMTPLMYLLAQENFSLEQCNFFLKHGSKFDVAHIPSLKAVFGLALKSAAECDRAAAFKKFLDAGSDMSAIDSGFNPIHHIVSFEHNKLVSVQFYVSIFKYFIDKGCDVDGKNKEGKTPIEIACYLGRADANKALLSFGAHPIIKVEDESGPLKVVMDDNVPSEDRKRTGSSYTTHSYKLEYIQVKSGNPNKMLKFILNTGSVDEDCPSLCQSEWKKIEKTKICKNLTVKSFIHDGASIYARMTASDQEIVDEYFKDAAIIIQKFPVFCGFLNMEYRNAVSKVKNQVSSESENKS